MITTTLPEPRILAEMLKEQEALRSELKVSPDRRTLLSSSPVAAPSQESSGPEMRARRSVAGPVPTEKGAAAAGKSPHSSLVTTGLVGLINRVYSRATRTIASIRRRTAKVPRH